MPCATLSAVPLDGLPQAAAVADIVYNPLETELLRAAKALQEQGTVPPGVEPAHQRVRSASVVLPPDKQFAEAVGDALSAKEGVEHVSV